MLQVGINPYGLTWALGLQGHGTPRANPDGSGLAGFIAIAREIGAETIELHNGWLAGMSDAGLDALRRQLDALRMIPIVSSGLAHEPEGAALRPAVALGARTIRLALTRLLCGDRNGLGPDWPRLVGDVRASLKRYAARAREAGVWLAIENHQDFGSQELVDLCREAGPNVGICFDIANAFAVAESPTDFALRVAPFVRHVHLKDYNVQFTDEGYRLVRSAIGDGAVPFVEVLAILAGHHASLTASIELAALEARPIRLFRPEWWNGYPPTTGPALAACLHAARRNRLAEDADYRTPWERGEDGAALLDYEHAQLRRSVDNLTALGIMGRKNA